MHRLAGRSVEAPILLPADLKNLSDLNQSAAIKNFCWDFHLLLYIDSKT